MYALQTLLVVVRRWMRLGVVATLSVLPAGAVAMAQLSSSFDADFGPAPESQINAARTPFTVSRGSRFQDEGRPSAGARDWLESQPKLPDTWPEGLPAPRRVKPSAPAISKPATPSTAEKIAKRYSDPRVVRIVQQLTPQSGEALFNEVSQSIDARHVQPTTYDDRVQAALEHLSLALQTPSFQQAAGINADRNEIRSVQMRLRSIAERAPVQNRAQAVGVMRETQQLLGQSWRINPAVACLEFVYGSLDTLDQFSMFIPPEKTGDAALGLKESMVGIGVELESCPEGLKILKAFTGGPAADATLQRGDIITAVDGQPLAGSEMSAAVDLISGRAGSPIKLDLKRGGMVGDVTLVRRPFKVQSVSAVRMEAGSVGYIKLEQFAESSARELDEALWKLHGEDMQTLIIDLRGNPGGLLTTAIALADRFLPSGTIVSTRGRTTMDNTQERAEYANTWKVPLVVLIDRNSASASEIFAAAIQENGRGLIVGEQSYGKGTVQTLFPLQSVPSALRLTTAKFYSPDGREMAGVGVTPDVKVPNMDRTGTGDRDAALQAALKAARNPNLSDMATRATKRSRSSMRVMTIAG